MEKIYKRISKSGIASIVAGTIIIAVGIATGIIAIISGAQMLAARNKLTF